MLPHTKTKQRYDFLPPMRDEMKSTFPIILFALLLCTVIGQASGKTNCGSVVAQIEAKLVSKGVTKYTLLIIAKDEATDSRVVGTCDGGAKKIIYKRG